MPHLTKSTTPQRHWIGFINTLRDEQNGCYSAEDIFKCIFLNKKSWTLILISLKFVPVSPIYNKSAFVQVDKWHGITWTNAGQDPEHHMVSLGLNSLHCCTAGGSLTHWGRVTHICVSKLTIIGSDNGLSPDRRQAIIWTNAGILSIGPLGTKLSEILIAIHIFSFKKMHLKMSSGKWQPSCLGLNVLIDPLVWRSVYTTIVPFIQIFVQFICVWRHLATHWHKLISKHHVDGLVQDCSNSSALAMELLQSCTKPSMLTFSDSYILCVSSKALMIW